MIQLMRHIGQSIFLNIESALNKIFGPTLNPFYYLGAIAYLMFWIIVVSGLYIYAFYDTGLEGSYKSVELITNKQWYLGGVMRSLHRYASDGLILFGILHLLRNFVLDRYRGFRWFSWYTGVAVLWLTYIAGINGYWLPWDKLAQFAAVASAEWLDALPIFSAPLVRNFLEQGSVNDRFFTLLSLIHLGVPLGAFALIWVHTQRVPQAKTSPPRALMVGLILSMLVLALIKPALSQGHADLDYVPLVLNLDWFYLWGFPMLYSWGPGKTWIAVGILNGILLLLPFIGKIRRSKEEYEITTVPAGNAVIAKKGETILEAALRQGLNLPYVCRDGACGTCKCRLLSGTVDYGIYQKEALTDSEKADGNVLTCCATPLSDLKIECAGLDESKKFPVKTMNFRVEKMERASPEVMLLELRPEGDERMNFTPGQYIAVHLDDGAKRSYSIANAPQKSGCLQLHIRLVEGGKFTAHVFNEMKIGDVLQADGPHGIFFLHEEIDKPIIFMAGGCGFGSVKGMVEYAFNTGSKRSMTLYWGARTLADLYSNLPEKWQREHDNFKFIPVLSEAKPEHGWRGRTGLVHEAIIQDYQKLDGYQIYGCGSSEMIEAARAPFIAKGLPQNHYFFDKFTFVCYKAPLAEAPASAEEVKHG